MTIKMAFLSFIIKSLLLISWLSLSECALMLTPAEVNRDFPSSCWNKRSNEAVPVGGTWQESSCIRASCTEYREKLYVELASCGVLYVPEGCTTIQESSRDYPSCCPRLYCHEETIVEPLLGPEYDEFNNWVETYYDDTSDA